MANTTHTVNPGGGADYTSLNAWEDAIDGTSYSASETATVNCSGSTADSTAVNIAGWDADVAIYINGNNTSGKYDTSKYRIEVSDYFGSVFKVNVSKIIFTGIQIRNTRTDAPENSGTCAVDIGNGYSNIVFKKSIFRANDRVYQTYQASGSSYLENCVIIAKYKPMRNYLHSATLNNCVIIGAAGLDRAVYGGTWVARNTYASKFANIDTVTTSASADGSQSTATVAYSTDTFTNVTAGSEDFHLVAGSDLIDAGTDLSGTFTEDIDGDTRSGTWDIGVDELVCRIGT